MLGAGPPTISLMIIATILRTLCIHTIISIQLLLSGGSIQGS